MSFSVAMISNEQADVIDLFVDFYLAAGAQEILIYLDFGAPCPSYPGQPAVTIIPCEEICQVDGIPQRPDSFYDLQYAVYDNAFGRFTSDWLLICDADEFVSGNGILEEALQAVPADWDYIRLPVAEAVWGPGDQNGAPYACTYFRTRAPKGFGKLLSVVLYGRVFPLTKAGLTGHAMGKYFVRRGSPYKNKLRAHVPSGVAWSDGPWASDIPSKPEIFVYHFEAIGYDRWRAKWGLRAKRGKPQKTNFNTAKRNYIDRFAQHQARGTERQLFEALYSINSVQAAILNIFGLLRRKQLW